MENNQELDNHANPDIESVSSDSGINDLENEQKPTDESADNPDSHPLAKKRGIRKALVVLVMILGIAAGLVWIAIQQAQIIPEFYQSVVDMDLQVAKREGREFERNLIRLQNASRRARPWQVKFTQDQINGWFASDLPEKFPEAIPKAISDPRVVLGEDRIQLGFKYDFRGATGYVVLDADVFCTDVSNEIAIRVSNVKAGIVPLPVGPWLEKVADSIRNAGIPVFWSRNSGTPVAIFTLPETITNVATNNVVVEQISLSPGILRISGTTNRIVTNKKPNDSDPEEATGKQ